MASEYEDLFRAAEAESVEDLLAAINEQQPSEKKNRDKTVLPAQNPKRKKKQSEEEPEQHVKVKKTMNRHIMRRLNSELQLEKELPWHFEQGTSYHCISMGDVDSLTYLRAIVKQQKCYYVQISTWCLAKTDIEEVADWLGRGYIGRCDFFLGEIFKGTYTAEYTLLKRVCKAYECRMAIFRNHSKVMTVWGEKFNAVIESSANVNTNPRTEQTTITLDNGLALFYKEFYDNIKSLDRGFDDMPPYDVGGTANSRKDA